MPKKLSRRPLKRVIRFEIQLGPYSAAFRDGQTRGRQHYVLWTTELPRGQKHRRFMAAVQLITRPGNLSDKIHNPILFQKIVVAPSEGSAKDCVHRAQHRLYWLLHDELKKATRPMLRLRAEVNCELPEEWLALEPGNSERVLGQWREEAMHQIGTWLGHWKHPYNPFHEAQW